MYTINELVLKLKEILRAGGIEDFTFEADCIACDLLGMDKTKLILDRDLTADPAKAKEAEAAAKKRCKGIPLQYILGKWEFYGLPFKVGEGVLIPRPETELLVDTVLKFYQTPRENMRILDLCSGSGCICTAIKKNLPEADITAIEASSDALPYLVENIRINDTPVRIIKGDIMNGALMENFADPENDGEYIKFGCIVSNPPYLTNKDMSELSPEVRCEPKEALYGGNDGLSFYRVICRLWSEVLEDGGLMAFEIGCEQGSAVSAAMADCGFGEIKVIPDLAGLDRVVVGMKKQDYQK